MNDNLRLIRKFTQDILDNKASSNYDPIFFNNIDGNCVLLYRENQFIFPKRVAILGYRDGNLYIHYNQQPIDLMDFQDPSLDEKFLVEKYGHDILDVNLIKIANKAIEGQMPPLRGNFLLRYLEDK